MSEQQYLAAEVALWLQTRCGDPWIFLGCHNLSGISAPRGDTNPVYCRIGKNKFEIQRIYRGAPGLGGMTVVAYDTILNYVQELNCAFNLIALHSRSGADDDPTNYDYLYYYNGVEVTSEDTDTHVIGQSPDEQTPVMISFPASFRTRLKVKDLSAQSRDVSSLTTNAIRAIAFCDEPSCDNFGNLDTIGCQTIYAVTEGASAIILKSTDGGSTWTSVSSPFTDANDNIIDVICDGDTIIAVNGTDTAYAYSWDNGINWTQVTTPTILLNAAIMLGAKVWFVGQSGRVLYSSNRGSSVTTQDAGQATSQSLNDISASDSLLLYAVGDNNAFIRTEDGGSTWVSVTGPATSIFPNDLYKVTAVPGTDTVFIGDERGNVYRSINKGTTWATVLPSNVNIAGGIRGLTICDCNVVLVAGNDNDPYFYGSSSGTIYKSVDGGNSWVTIEIPTNTGIWDLVCCDVNRYWTSGEGGFIARISGPSVVMP